MDRNPSVIVPFQMALATTVTSTEYNIMNNVAFDPP